MRKREGSSWLNELRLRKIKGLTRRVCRLESVYKNFTDQELQIQTQVFKERLAAGEDLDSLLVEAFAVVREACRRVLGQFPFPVQVMGAIALHQGSVAEMRTGEGKTLTATMPLYLNALVGKGALLVTTNDYLARRDAEEMGQVYHFLGLSVGLAAFDSEQEVTVQEKRAVYAADITYVTGSGLGFDYLMDNLASSHQDKFLRPFHYAIVDEADAVLLDGAQTPLIISGTPRVQSNLYAICNQFILTLQDEDVFFDPDTKELYLTDTGLSYAERYFAVPSLFDQHQWELNRQINLALRAHYLYRKNYDYVVKDDEVILLDKRTGRLLEGTRMQSGIHQAIEAKESVKLTKDNRAMGSVTYQSLFNLFPKLAGMTGTGVQAEEELISTYNLQVIAIPTHQPIRRKDYPDKFYRSLPEKLYATIKLVKQLHQTGQPVLLVSGTVEVTQIYSKLLLQEGIAHNTLTANNIAKEALIIQEAGQRGAVTCATIMAGRGTDIKLGPGVEKLGGLAVIGTERMPNQRMDWQLRGRAGRQGEVGMSQFFVSLEDELLTTYGPEWVKNYLRNQSRRAGRIAKDGQILSAGPCKRAIRHAQEKSEEFAVQSRQQTIQFDESLRIQREKIYQLRDDLIFQKDLLEPRIMTVINQVIQAYVTAEQGRTEAQIRRYILENYTYQFQKFPEDCDVSNPEELAGFLQDLVYGELERKARLLGSIESMEEFYRLAVLKAIDECWVEEVDSLQQLKGVVPTRSLAQRDGMQEYYKESLRSYEQMTGWVHERIVSNLMLSTIEVTPTGQHRIYFV